MGVELLGVLASTITVISTLGWALERNAKNTRLAQESHNETVEKIYMKINALQDTLTTVRLEMPEKYITKEELYIKMQNDERRMTVVENRLAKIEDAQNELSKAIHSK